MNSESLLFTILAVLLVVSLGVIVIFFPLFLKRINGLKDSIKGIKDTRDRYGRVIDQMQKGTFRHIESVINKAIKKRIDSYSEGQKKEFSSISVVNGDDERLEIFYRTVGKLEMVLMMSISISSVIGKITIFRNNMKQNEYPITGLDALLSDIEQMIMDFRFPPADNGI